MADLTAVSRAISATREGLAAAGYAIDCAQAPAGALLFTVRALDAACQECLVPKSIFSAILTQELADAGIVAASVELVYPLDDEA